MLSAILSVTVYQSYFISSHYASVGGAPRHMLVVVFVCVCVLFCSMLFSMTATKSNESCNATTARHSSAPLN